MMRSLLRRQQWFSSIPSDALTLNYHINRCNDLATLETLFARTSPALFVPDNCVSFVQKLSAMKRKKPNSNPSPLLIHKVLSLLELANLPSQQLHPTSTTLLPRHVSKICREIAVASLLPSIPSELVAFHLVHINAFSAFDLTESLWSFAVLRQREEEIFNSVSKRIVSRPHFLCLFAPEQVAKLVWSYATLKESDSAQLLFQEIARDVSQHRDWPLPVFSTLLSAFALLNVSEADRWIPPSFLTQEQVSQLSNKELFRVLHALGMTRQWDLPLFRCRLPRKPTGSNLERTYMHQLILASQFLSIESPLLEELKQSLWMMDTKQLGTEKTKGPLTLTQELTRRLGEGVELNVVYNAALTFDLFLPHKKLVIELTHAFEYAANGTTLLGPVQFKHWLIEQSGFELCVINLQVFFALSQERQHVMLEELTRHIRANF